MRHWTSIAEQLGNARRAEEDFLVRDLVESSIIGPMLLDRVAADLADFSTAENAFSARISMKRNRRPVDD